MLLVFTATDQSRLVQRLLEVCRVEGMRASLSALTALCDKAENDIRSCLNTLQVMQTYKHGCYYIAPSSVVTFINACHLAPQTYPLVLLLA